MQPSSFVNWIALLELDEAFILLSLPVALFAGIGALVIRVLFGSSIATTSTVGTTKAGAAAEIYAVVLGFVILFGFNQFQETKRAVLLETSLLDRLRIEADLLPQNTDEIADAINAYVAEVAEVEWPLQAVGQSEGVVTESVRDLEAAVRQAAVSSSDLSAFRLNKLIDNVLEQRVIRLSASPDAVVATAVFQILIVGILLSVITGWFVRGPSVLLHMALSAMISGAVVFLMVLSAQLLYPFAGPIAISEDSFAALLSAGNG